MCLEGMHIVHIGLPVFDKASVVRGDHPRAVVAPLHAAHRTVMTLNGEGGREEGEGGGRRGKGEGGGGGEGEREGRRGKGGEGEGNRGGREDGG